MTGMWSRNVDKQYVIFGCIRVIKMDTSTSGVHHHHHHHNNNKIIYQISFLISYLILSFSIFYHCSVVITNNRQTSYTYPSHSEACIYKYRIRRLKLNTNLSISHLVIFLKILQVVIASQLPKCMPTSLQLNKYGWISTHWTIKKWHLIFDYNFG